MVKVATSCKSTRPDEIQRQGCVMRSETHKFELERLRRQQAKTRADEVFGGLSWAERAAYDLRQCRIRELEHDLSERSGEEEPQRDRDVAWNPR
jgi:hypothetical protein